jgi:hypothetical protein
VDYPELLVQARARNSPQPEVGSSPVDFVAAALPDTNASGHSYWLYKGTDSQIVIDTDGDGCLRLRPVKELDQQDAGLPVQMGEAKWRDGLPLRLWEDPMLQIPAGKDKASWLSSWHSEQEWLQATHKCRYSTAVIGIPEELSPIGPEVPGKPGMDPVLLRYEKRRRSLVQTDFHVFAADHWNFNARFPNPGGNHGAFFRISTHSVWMMAGPEVPKRSVDEPHDGLNFASTALSLLGKEASMPERVVNLQ